MSSDNRELNVRTTSIDSAVVLSVSGEVDMVSAPKLSAAVAESLATVSQLLILDLTEVGFFGSAGLSVLVEALESVGGRELRVVGSVPVRRPIELTGLDEMLEVYDTLDAALAGKP
ncbi:STAS domain-containing protein [Nocardia sp. NBC_01327]|uniref:STAS domain-containing protein n=1 Tax=Nocardia sp. NBC_01327 TaxID=2903593 RepID=UPI002E155A88|nr:STAS domain-containing protein [Nocardia sp. NBC_01327]